MPWVCSASSRLHALLSGLIQARFCKMRLYQCFRVITVSKHPQEQLQKTSHPSYRQRMLACEANLTFFAAVNMEDQGRRQRIPFRETVGLPADR